MIYEKMKSAPPLCRRELEPVSVKEIECAERELLEGLNYELRCFHPYGAIRVLASDMASFLIEETNELAWPEQLQEKRDPAETSQREIASPRAVSEESQDNLCHRLHEKAMAIAHNALLFSDVPFLFPPGKIAFAAVAIAMKNDARDAIVEFQSPASYLTRNMKKYLRIRFPLKAEKELRYFEHQVSRIIQFLDQNNAMDLSSLAAAEPASHGHQAMTKKVQELRRIMEKIPRLRKRRKAEVDHEIGSPSRKRKSFHENCLFSNEEDAFAIKLARVTPI